MLVDEKKNGVAVAVHGNLAHVLDVT